jgi:catechol 2,3-dioxygenase-like lactoylglutathione lyase family enzyme
MLTGLAPVLLVTDVRVAAEYYRDRLGFDVDFYDRIPEHYAYASRDGCRVHFARFEGVAPRPNVEVVPPDMFDVYFWVDDVDVFHDELVARGAEVIQAPTDQGYGQRDIRVRDPFGYILAFGQPLG